MFFPLVFLRVLILSPGDYPCEAPFRCVSSFLFFSNSLCNGLSTVPLSRAVFFVGTTEASACQASSLPIHSSRPISPYTTPSPAFFSRKVADLIDHLSLPAAHFLINLTGTGDCSSTWIISKVSCPVSAISSGPLSGTEALQDTGNTISALTAASLCEISSVVSCAHPRVSLDVSGLNGSFSER